MYDLAKLTNDYQMVEILLWFGHKLVTVLWHKEKGKSQYLAIHGLIAELKYVYLISKELKNFLRGLPKRIYLQSVH